jgi:hypothetical protein
MCERPFKVSKAYFIQNLISIWILVIADGVPSFLNSMELPIESSRSSYQIFTPFHYDLWERLLCWSMCTWIILYDKSLSATRLVSGGGFSINPSSSTKNLPSNYSRTQDNSELICYYNLIKIRSLIGPFYDTCMSEKGGVAITSIILIWLFLSLKVRNLSISKCLQ